MDTNRTKAKLLANQVVVGASITIPSPELVELAAVVGFDFVTLDAEHEPLDDQGIVHMIRAAQAFDITPIVRLPKDPHRTLLFLNAGAQGIHVARCNSPAEVRALVEWSRFYPQGKRTFYALGRSANYGVDIDDRKWSVVANRELLLVAMIEDVEAVNNLEEILAVPHFDVIHVGPKDLWQSMGMPATNVVEEVVAQISTAAVAAGKHVSIQLRLGPDVQERIAGHVHRGVRMITVSPLDFIRSGGPAFTSQVRNLNGRL